SGDGGARRLIADRLRRGSRAASGAARRQPRGDPRDIGRGRAGTPLGRERGDGGDQDRPTFRQASPRPHRARAARPIGLYRAREPAEPADRTAGAGGSGQRPLFRDSADFAQGVEAMTGELPAGAAIIVLGASGAALGQRVRELLPGAQPYGPRGLASNWDETS